MPTPYISVRFELALIAAAWLFACGSPPEPAMQQVAAPPVQKPVAPAPAPTAKPAATAEPPPAPAASATPPEAAPEATTMERTQKPLAMITARDAAFLIDYANSAPKEAAQARCEKAAKGDPDKTGACLTKEREQFQPDVLRFRKDSETQTSLVVYKRVGTTLRELSIGVVELNEEGDTVRVKFTGRSKGTRPIWRGRPQGTLRVPNDYSIEIDEPELGLLRYEAKIGLVTN